MPPRWHIQFHEGNAFSEQMVHNILLNFKWDCNPIKVKNHSLWDKRLFTAHKGLEGTFKSIYTNNSLVYMKSKLVTTTGQDPRCLSSYIRFFLVCHIYLGKDFVGGGFNGPFGRYWLLSSFLSLSYLPESRKFQDINPWSLSLLLESLKMH